MMSIDVRREIKTMPTKRHLRHHYPQPRAVLDDSNQDKTDSVKQRLSKFRASKQAVKREEPGILTKGNCHLSFAEATPVSTNLRPALEGYALFVDLAATGSWKSFVCGIGRELTDPASIA
ncbi:hypothetical protein FOMA001_g13503 [Fusarium oxysporum f. sp. matthiolae]|nr:hypothetical protein FOMA001_g13503 [Fusarium oxysporum f. sp. matthiolae]